MTEDRSQPTASRRIAGAYRERIAVGELRPGDRMPSTRQLVRDWGVAMATASRAIAILREEGLVTTRPGSGTIVSGRPTTPRRTTAPAKNGLERGRIVAAAIGIADRSGLEDLSMRRLAGVLGVAPMALYHHVAGRDELEFLMVRAVFAANPLPSQRPEDWRVTLEAVYALQWRILRAHPWLAELLSVTRPLLAPEAMAHSEWTFEALAAIGLTPVERLRSTLALAALVRGLALGALGELRAEEESRLRNTQWWATIEADAAALMATGRYPRLAEVVHTVTATGLDSLDDAFTEALSRYLDGLAARAS